MRELILIPDPHPHSRAALVQLRRELAILDDSRRAFWLRFRAAVLATWLEQRGDLVCHYCGRPGLVIEDYNIKKVATLDHVMPLSRGGAKFDLDNLVVACSACNGRKANLHPDEFQ